jgi:hypothetical protein
MMQVWEPLLFAENKSGGIVITAFKVCSFIISFLSSLYHDLLPMATERGTIAKTRLSGSNKLQR